MRKIIIEFILPKENEADYANVCPELVIEDFLGQPLRVLSDTVILTSEPTFTNAISPDAGGTPAARGVRRKSN